MLAYGVQGHGWVVAGSAALVVAVGCGAPSGPVADADRVQRGREVYVFESCGSCHGAERQGGKNAPPLERLDRHWATDELVTYLRGPRAYPKDRRLRTLAARYPQEMAGLPGAGEERLRDLVAYLLSR